VKHKIGCTGLFAVLHLTVSLGFWYFLICSINPFQNSATVGEDIIFWSLLSMQLPLFPVIFGTPPFLNNFFPLDGITFGYLLFSSLNSLLYAIFFMWLWYRLFQPIFGKRD